MKSLFLILTLFVSTSLYGQSTVNPDSLYTMDDVIITYRATPTTPISFRTISQREIQKVNYGQEPSLILRNTPGFTTYSDAGSGNGYSYFRLRGIDQTRLNMTLDGMPLNEPEDQGVYFSNYPDIFSSVSSVQIQRGTGMTQNGTASYGGSVQLSSPSLWDDKYTNFNIGLGSFNSKRFSIEHNTGINSEVGTYVRISHIESDGYRDNVWNNSQSVFYSSGYYKPSYNIKLVSFIGRQRNGMGWLGVPLEQINQRPQTNVNTKNEDDSFTQGMVSVQTNVTLSDRFQLQNAFYYNFLEGNYDFDLDAFLGLSGTEFATNEFYNYDLRSGWIGTFTNLIYVNNGLESVTGIHLNNYERRHVGSELQLGELYQNTGIRNEVSVHQRIENDINRFTLFGDFQLRYTNFLYEGDVQMDKQTWLFFNPRIGASYTLGLFNVYTSVGSTGREPTRNDMFGGEDNLVEVYQTQPEYVTNYEVGVRLRSDRNVFTLNGYYMDFRNEITLNGQFGPNGIALTQNVETSVRSGVEFDYMFNSDRFQYGLNGSFSDNRIKDQGNSFKPILSPEFIVNNLIDVRLGKFNVGTTLRYQGESYIDFSNTEVIDGFFVTDLRLSLDVKDITISLYINNVTDERYFTNGYVDMFDGEPRYHIQSPRNYFTTVKYNF